MLLHFVINFKLAESSEMKGYVIPNIISYKKREKICMYATRCIPHKARVGRRHLVLRHFVPHFPPNFRDIARVEWWNRKSRFKILNFI